MNLTLLTAIALMTPVFRDMTPCGIEREKSILRKIFAASIFITELLYLEDGGSGLFETLLLSFQIAEADNVHEKISFKTSCYKICLEWLKKITVNCQSTSDLNP